MPFFTRKSLMVGLALLLSAMGAWLFRARGAAEPDPAADARSEGLVLRRNVVAPPKMNENRQGPTSRKPARPKPIGAAVAPGESGSAGLASNANAAPPGFSAARTDQKPRKFQDDWQEAHESTDQLHSASRTHRIVDGDTLADLAARYLGDAQRAKEIYRVNRDVLPARDVLPIGVEITLPPHRSAASEAAVPAKNESTAKSPRPFTSASSQSSSPAWRRSTRKPRTR